MKTNDPQVKKPSGGSHELSSRHGGPRTAQGKQKAKYNRLEHAIFARVVLKEEERDYETFLASFREVIQPVGGLEQFLVQKLAFVCLRFGRMYKADANATPLLFDAIARGLTENHCSLITELANKKDEVSLIRKEPSPDLLLRYETGLERQFDRILAQLERLQHMRLGLPVPPPVKVELS
jgi:hypothetical protein